MNKMKVYECDVLALILGGLIDTFAIAALINWILSID